MFAFVLMAYHIQDQQNDPEVLVDLQYKLAKNYTNSPEQRKAWLDSMSLIHLKTQNFSEVMYEVMTAEMFLSTRL